MKYGMEDFLYGMEMEWTKIACMEYGKIVSIPFHAMPYRQHKSNKIAFKVNLPAFFST